MVIASGDGASARYPIDSSAASKLVKHGITKQGWEALLSFGEESTLREGELLMIQGDQPKDAEDREVYLLLSGECRLEVRGSEVARLLPGDFVGEGSFTSGTSGPRSSTVRSKGEKGTEVLAWFTSDLRSFMAEPTNAPVTVALQACWMSGLAGKLNDVMSALAGEPSSDVKGGDEVEVGDYGFRYPEDTREVESVVPVTSFRLAWWNFAREYRSLRRTFRFGQFKDTWIAGPFSLIDRFLETSIFPELRPSRVDLPRDPAVQDLQRRLGELKLSNEAIWQRENSRIVSTRELLKNQTRQGLVQASILLQSQTPWYVMLPYRFLCWVLDVIFEDRPIQRFWFLETVARMPYFSYLSSLHFLETLGWWNGGAEVRRVHFAEVTATWGTGDRMGESRSLPQPFLSFTGRGVGGQGDFMLEPEKRSTVVVPLGGARVERLRVGFCDSCGEERPSAWRGFPERRRRKGPVGLSVSGHATGSGLDGSGDVLGGVVGVHEMIRDGCGFYFRAERFSWPKARPAVQDVTTYS